jgi:hypothetical protein
MHGLVLSQPSKILRPYVINPEVCESSCHSLEV